MSKSPALCQSPTPPFLLPLPSHTQCILGCLSPLSNITSTFSSVCYIEIIQLLTLTHIHNITSSSLLYIAYMRCRGCVFV